eukprot:3352568-Amphidinium_carterae.1
MQITVPSLVTCFCPLLLPSFPCRPGWFTWDCDSATSDSPHLAILTRRAGVVCWVEGHHTIGVNRTCEFVEFSDFAQVAN